MALRLDSGHHAAVIGAGGAIGRAICVAYAKAGATVTGLDVDPAAAERATGGFPERATEASPERATEVFPERSTEANPERATGTSPERSARVLALDVTSRDDVARAVAGVTAERGVDSVVYAAGLAPTFDVLDFDWDSYHRTLAVNLHGALHVAQAFGAAMVAAGRGGCFTFLSSTAGKRGEAGAAAYCASKFAIEGVVQCFAAEVGARGIRVNAICPGDVDTPMLRGVAAAQAAREGTDPDDVLVSYAARSATRRLVTPEEVAAVAVWLASPLAAGVTGESVNVDAGLLTG